MSEAVVKISCDAKNFIFERPPVKSHSDDSGMKPLKRRAPKLPPKNKPRRELSDD